jgi:hypothetical protein
MAYEITDWERCHRNERGHRVWGDPELVTVVPRDEIDSFLGARNRREREAHLRGLRDQGNLISKAHGLQIEVRNVGRAYVFPGPAHEVPVIRTRPRVGWV